MDRHRRYHPLFADDLTSATTYYDRISVPLGNRFRDLVRKRLATITENPELFARIHNDIRASVVDRFPYVILYEVQHDFVVMLGIHHVASDRSGWFERSGD
jgi:plasmid stabilization system protein ParE